MFTFPLPPTAAFPVIAAVLVMLFVPGGAAQSSSYCLIGFVWATWTVYERTRSWAWSVPTGVIGAVLIYAIYRLAYAIGS